MAKKPDQKREELADDPALLPDREALSVIPPYPEVDALLAAAHSAAGEVTADASATGEETVTSEDRDEHISATDTATAES